MHRCGQTSRFDDTSACSCINICAFMYRRFVFIFRNPCFSPWDMTESILLHRGEMFSGMLICFFIIKGKLFYEFAIDLQWVHSDLLCGNLSHCASYWFVSLLVSFLKEHTRTFKKLIYYPLRNQRRPCGPCGFALPVLCANNVIIVQCVKDTKCFFILRSSMLQHHRL